MRYGFVFFVVGSRRVVGGCFTGFPFSFFLLLFLPFLFLPPPLFFRGETLTSPFSYKHPYSSYKEEVSQFLQSLRSPSPTHRLSLHPPPPTSSYSSSPSFSLYPISPLLQIIRLFKSPSEISLMRSACSLTDTAFREGMWITREGLTEHQLMSSIQYASQMSGATRFVRCCCC